MAQHLSEKLCLEKQTHLPPPKKNPQKKQKQNNPKVELAQALSVA